MKKRNSLGLDGPPHDFKIVVAMSGGVDSSVVAAMLAEEGFNVIGITLQLYDHREAIQKKGACCAGSDIHDARRVAGQLNIPHYVLDYESKFRDQVINDFADEYIAGRTPIPCVRCNQTVKFTDLFKMAKDLNADALATGHYVQRIQGKEQVELHRGIDIEKDQSYFLFATTPEQLNFLRFPLGKMNKEKTRKLAEQFDLTVKNKADSQDICFVPNGKYSDVVRKLRPGSIDPGNIIYTDGTIVGRHKGIIDYTIGQRKGLGIGGRSGIDEDRLYVIDINADNNEVVVGPREALKVIEVIIEEYNWIGNNSPKNNRKINVRLRNTGDIVPARFMTNNNQVRIKLDSPSEGISPGQAVVIYDIDFPSRVLGGGWIKSTISNHPAVNSKSMSSAA